MVGSQAFYYASGFNANIGGWNTASVKDMSSVCAPSAVRNRSAEAAVARRKQSPAQMWAESQAEVGQSQGTCG